MTEREVAELVVARLKAGGAWPRPNHKGEYLSAKLDGDEVHILLHDFETGEGGILYRLEVTEF